MIDRVLITRKYRDHLAVKNFSKVTVKCYTSLLNCFFNYMEGAGITDITAAGKDAIRDYQAHCYETVNARGEPNCVGTQNNHLKAVKCFFRFLRQENYIVADPAKDVDFARKPKRLPRSILTPAEMRKLLHAPDVKTTLGYRDRTILELLYTSGLRKAEIEALQLADVDYHEGFVRVNAGKGNKDRVVPIGKISCRYLENYVKGVRPALIRDPLNNHLFLTLSGKRFGSSALWFMVKYYARKARIKKNISPHSFRHTCATLMLRNKANIRHIQEMLGHENLNTTQIYAQVSIADLKEVHSRCHPREQDKE
jgi:integrase/recombinase XerD